MHSLAYSYSTLIYGMIEVFQNHSGENFAEYQLMASDLFSSPFLIPVCRDTPGRDKRPSHGWVSRCALSMAELSLSGYMEHMYNLLFILSHLGCLFLLLRERSAENWRRITGAAQVKGVCRVNWLCCVWPSEHPCQDSCCWARPLPPAWEGKAAISPLFIGSFFSHHSVVWRSWRIVGGQGGRSSKICFFSLLPLWLQLTSLCSLNKRLLPALRLWTLSCASIR